MMLYMERGEGKAIVIIKAAGGVTPEKEQNGVTIKVAGGMSYVNQRVVSQVKGCISVTRKGAEECHKERGGESWGVSQRSGKISI